MRFLFALGGATNYTYDDMGRLVSESTMSGGTVTYTYNALNLKSQLTNARGQTRNFTYDVMGRITGCTDPDDSTAFTYDANGSFVKNYFLDIFSTLTGFVRVICYYYNRNTQ